MYVLIYIYMGWLRLVGSLKLQVFFAEYSLFNRALLQKSPIILSAFPDLLKLWSFRLVPLHFQHWELRWVHTPWIAWFLKYSPYSHYMKIYGTHNSLYLEGMIISNVRMFLFYVLIFIWYVRQVYGCLYCTYLYLYYTYVCLYYTSSHDVTWKEFRLYIYIYIYVYILQIYFKFVMDDTQIEIKDTQIMMGSKKKNVF